MARLEVDAIARAFLVPEATMAKRLARARSKIATARIPYVIPSDAQFPERLGAVLAVVYLIATEAHAPTGGNAVARVDLEAEAVRLARLLVELMPDENLTFMREHRNHMVAIVEISRGGLTAGGQQRFSIAADLDEAVQTLAQHLADYQDVGELCPDFDPQVMAVAIRAAMDAIPRRLAHDPDLDNYTRGIANIYQLATSVVAEV